GGVAVLEPGDGGCAAAAGGDGGEQRAAGGGTVVDDRGTRRRAARARAAGRRAIPGVLIVEVSAAKTRGGQEADDAAIRECDQVDGAIRSWACEAIAGGASGGARA